jgi:hypothetical protein
MRCGINSTSSTIRNDSAHSREIKAKANNMHDCGLHGIVHDSSSTIVNEFNGCKGIHEHQVEVCLST